MTPATFASLARKMTRTNSTTFPDADILLFANAFKDEMAAEIVELDEDYFVMEFTRDLVADQRAYAFPAEVLTQIKYVEAKLDDSKWSVLDEFDLNGLKKPTNEANIILHFSSRLPQFDLNARALKIFSGDAIIAVTDGLKLNATMYPKDLSDLTLTTDMSLDPSSTEFGIPRPMHELLCRRVIIAFKSSKDKPIPLSEKELSFENDWERVRKQMKGQNKGRSTVPKMPVLTGQDS